MIPYILLSYGRKPGPSPGRHPAARQQAANIAYVAKTPANSMKAVVEHARRVTSLSCLPKLQRALAVAKAKDDQVLMDDLGRLFRACKAECRASFAEELAPHREVLVGARQGGPLSNLDEKQLDYLQQGRPSARYVLATTPRPKKSAEQLRSQTEDAALASREARRRSADVKAEHLKAIKDELEREHDRVTNRMIADEANSRGIKTTRGGEWRQDTVARSLKRLERPTPAEKAKTKRVRS